MKNKLILLILGSLILACNSLQTGAGLSQEKAKAAIDRFNKNRGTVTIKGAGVREVPAQNAAIAEISVSLFNFKTSDGLSKTINGNGVATFSHYTDGRWVLSKVVIDDGYMNWNFEPNIDAN